MTTVAPTQVGLHKQYQRTFSHASQCFTVSKFHLGVSLSSSIATVDTAQDLDVIVDLDHHLTMSMHVSPVCRGAYCFLCQLRQVVRSVSVDAAKTVHAFISSIAFRLLQPLLYGISYTLLCPSPIFGRPFVKRFALCYRSAVRPVCLSVLYVCLSVCL